MKNHELELVWVTIILVLGYLFCGLIGGCASTSCRPPEARAAERGVVLECRTIQKKGHPYKSCLVLVPGGNTANLAYKTCPVR